MDQREEIGGGGGGRSGIQSVTGPGPTVPILEDGIKGATNKEYRWLPPAGNGLQLTSIHKRDLRPITTESARADNLSKPKRTSFPRASRTKYSPSRSADLSGETSGFRPTELDNNKFVLFKLLDL